MFIALRVLIACVDAFAFLLDSCGNFPDTMGRACELLEKECEVDFIDLNAGCPIDQVALKGQGSCKHTSNY